MSDNNIKLEVIQWKKISESALEEFSKAVASENGKKLFNEDWMKSISDRLGRTYTFYYKTVFIYGTLMTVLFASQYQRDFDFQIFGIAAKGISQSKEYLLFIAMTVGVIGALAKAHANHLDSLLTTAIKATFSEDSSRYIEHKYKISTAGMFERDRTSGIAPHAMTLVILSFLLLSFMMMALIYVAAAFFIPISVITDIATSKSPMQYVNIFIIVYSISAFIFGLSLMLLSLPLPHINSQGYREALAVKENDQSRFSELMKKWAAESIKRERRFSEIIPIIIYIPIFTISSLIFIGSNYVTSIKFALSGGIGLIATWLLCTQLSKLVRKAAYRWFFPRYDENHPDRIEAFSRLERTRVIINFAIPIALSMYISYNNIKITKLDGAGAVFMQTFTG